MARLAAGVEPTPHKERLKIYRATLEREGGKRLIVDIEKDAADALTKLKKRHGTAKDAVSYALIEAARGLR